MRSLIIVSVLLVVALSIAESVPPRGCAYRLGTCYEECPVGTHAYTIGCGYRTPEATCREPNPVPETAMLCDYSKCHCNSPTVRDEKTDQCVLLENCTPEEPEPCETK